VMCFVLTTYERVCYLYILGLRK